MKLILSKPDLKRTITRLAHQLLEDVELNDVVFIGIQPRGIFVAERILAEMKTLCGSEKINYGVLDITFYRDDVRQEFHIAQQTKIDTEITGKRVVLIDDVLYTGRTVRAALDALQDFGRPKKVELAVLINRQFSRELPIQPDYCGIAVNTQPSQKIKANWQAEEVMLYE